MKFGVGRLRHDVWDGGLFDAGRALNDLKKIVMRALSGSRPKAARTLSTRPITVASGWTSPHAFGPSIETSIRWTSALGKAYVWTAGERKDFRRVFRQVNVRSRSVSAGELPSDFTITSGRWWRVSATGDFPSVLPTGLRAFRHRPPSGGCWGNHGADPEEVL